MTPDRVDVTAAIAKIVASHAHQWVHADSLTPAVERWHRAAAAEVIAALSAAGRLREHVATALTDTEVEELLAKHPLDSLWGAALDASHSRDFRGGDEDGELDEDAYLRYRRRALDSAYADVLAGLAGLLPEGGEERTEEGWWNPVTGQVQTWWSYSECGYKAADRRRTVRTFLDGSEWISAWTEVTE